MLNDRNLADLRRFVETPTDQGAEGVIEAADAAALRMSLIKLQGKRRVHFLRAVLWAGPLSFAVLRGVPLEGAILLLFSVLAVLMLLESWRALDAHRGLQAAVRLAKTPESTCVSAEGKANPSTGGQSP